MILVHMQGVLETTDSAYINKKVSECASKQRTCPRTLGALFAALRLSSLANVLSLEANNSSNLGIKAFAKLAISCIIIQTHTVFTAPLCYPSVPRAIARLLNKGMCNCGPCAHREEQNKKWRDNTAATMTTIFKTDPLEKWCSFFW